MRTLTIIELDTGGFLLKAGKTNIVQAFPEEGPISVCAKLGNYYDSLSSTDTLPGAVWAFFLKPEPPVVG